MTPRFRTPGMVPVLLCAALGMSSALAQAPPDCQCRAPDGNPRDLGVVECVTITGRAWLVRCEMSTNTPYWKRMRAESGCSFA